MGTVALRSSRALSHLLQRKRTELRLSLQDVSDWTAETGERIPTSTLARIERGMLDPGVWRFHQLLRLYRLPPDLVADLVEVEAMSAEQPSARDLETLYNEGLAHLKKGDVPNGLACLLAVRQYVPPDENSRLVRQKAIISFAIAVRTRGKLPLALRLVNDLLVEPPDPSLVLNVLILASSIWRGLGSLQPAWAFLERAEALLTPGNPQERAWVLHQKARLLLSSGEAGKAADELEWAVISYRAVPDPYGESKARLLRVDVIDALGETARATESSRDVIRFAMENEFKQIAIEARMKLGRLLVKTERLEEGFATLNEVLAEGVRTRDNHAQFLAHHGLFKVYESVGDRDRARVELHAAGYFSQFVNEESAEADEVRTLLEAEGTRERKRRSRRHPR